MKKSMRPETSNPKDGVDLISNMPDAILLLILSRLSSTEEGIRSSILSRRWRHVWTAIPSLDLCIYEKSSKTSEFKEFVYWVLVNRSVDLDRFRLDCSNHYSMSTVQRWIHGAVTKNVKHLDLTFCPKENNEDIEMPHCLVTCCSLEVVKLNLSERGLRLRNSKGFPALRVLHLTCVDLLEDEDLVKDFFQSCPLLEDLALLECLIFKLDLLCISCLKLKKLSITNLEYDDDDVAKCAGIKICCPKLVDLELSGHTAYSFFFECLDSLKKAVIESKWEGNTKSVLFPGISSVEYLSIDLSLFSECFHAALDPALPNLKNLVLTSTFDDFTMNDLNRILNISPELESLKLIVKQVFLYQMDFDVPEEWEFHEGPTMRILTPDVKRAELFEFNGEKPKLATYRCADFLEMFFIWGNEARF